MSKSWKLLLILLVLTAINCNSPLVKPTTPPDQSSNPLDGVTMGSTEQEDSTSSEADPKAGDLPTQDPSIDSTGGQGGDLIPILPAGTDIMIFEIQMVGNLAGWGIGGANHETEHVFKTLDGGITWQDVTPPQPVITGYGDFTTVNLGSWDGDHAWVNYTGSNLIWTTKNGGASWEAKPVTYTTHPYSMISVLDENQIWIFQFLDSAMHTVVTALVHSTDGGDSWDLIVDPYLDEDIQSFYKTGSVFIDPQSGWLTRNFDGVTPNVTLSTTLDGGSTWDLQAIPTPPAFPDIFNEGACGLYDPYLVAPDVGYFRLSCLYDQNGQLMEKDFLYKTDKGGMSFDILDTPGGEIYYLNDLTMYSLGKDIERSIDGGQSWQYIKTVNWEGQFSFIDQSTAWAVAADRTDWENPIFALMKTTNGCQSFTEIDPVLINSSIVR